MIFRTMLLVGLLLPCGAAAQDRSSLTEELDEFAATHFDWLQPRSIRDRIGRGIVTHHSGR